MSGPDERVVRTGDRARPEGAGAARVVIVTGASSGIGEATAERFADAGDLVVNLDIRPPARPRGPWLEVDVADWQGVRQAVAAVHAEHGGLDVAIANAGISVRHPVLAITEAEARRTLEVNLLGVLALWQAAAELMLPRRRGVLLATASVNGTRGYPRYADYNASKAGVTSLCQTFALELAPYIRTACVTPGAVLTPMQRAEYTDEMLAEVNACIPMGRHAAPAEIAAAFHFLASDQAGFITGQEFVVDGGETAGATTAFLALPDKPAPDAQAPGVPTSGLSVPGAEVPAVEVPGVEVPGVPVPGKPATYAPGTATSHRPAPGSPAPDRPSAGPPPPAAD